MAVGKIIKINNGGQHGTIERSDDTSGDWYQFRIPQDCKDGFDPEGAKKAGSDVAFTTVTDTARRAESVQLNGDGGL